MVRQELEAGRIRTGAIVEQIERMVLHPLDLQKIGIMQIRIHNGQSGITADRPWMVALRVRTAARTGLRRGVFGAGTSSRRHSTRPAVLQCRRRGRPVDVHYRGNRPDRSCEVGEISGLAWSSCLHDGDLRDRSGGGLLVRGARSGVLAGVSAAGPLVTVTYAPIREICIIMS
jgi:hypothetical protein